MRFEGQGCVGYLDVSLHCPSRVRRVTVCGDEGTLTWDADREETVVLTTYNREGKLRRKAKGFKFDESQNVRFMLQAFVECCAGGEGNVERSVAVSDALGGLR